MRKLLMAGATVISAMVLSASPISVKWSAQDVSVSQDKARAAVGQPLSAGSVAGVHRRHERREHRHGHHSGSSFIGVVVNTKIERGKQPGSIGKAAGRQPPAGGFAMNHRKSPGIASTQGLLAGRHSGACLGGAWVAALAPTRRRSARRGAKGAQVNHFLDELVESPLAARSC
jgi:hypothetical protein